MTRPYACLWALAFGVSCAPPKSDGDDTAGDADCAETAWYADEDGDGFGNAAASVSSCTAPTGFVDNNQDCDDTDSDAFPGGTETCDGADGDCDGTVDSPPPPDAPIWWTDADGDGHGDPTAVVRSCSEPPGAASPDEAADCDDTHADIHPGATEIWYDGIDSDCDGDSDYDADGDRQDSIDFDGTDCDDTDSAVYAGAPDTWYDGIDSDCAGNSDYDADLDGYNAIGHDGSDCNDDDDTTHPGAAEVCMDGIDDDCDGKLTCTVSAPTYALLTGESAGDLAGTAVAWLGDLDGDGNDDIGVTAPHNDSNGWNGGATYVFTHPVTGTAAVTTATATITSPETEDQSGSALAGVPDLDGDGYNDLIIGIPGRAGTYSGEGAAVVFLGPLSGPLELDDADHTILGAGATVYTGVGAAVSAQSDIDGDGTVDLVLGTNGAGAHVFDGASLSTDATLADALVHLSHTSRGTGQTLATGCDINGDGLDDVLVGSPGTGGDTTSYVYLGPLTASPEASFVGSNTGDTTGRGLTCAGDTNLDGYDDWWIGAPLDGTVASAAGALFLFTGPSSGTLYPWDAAATLRGSQDNDYLGQSASMTEDIYSDGWVDLVVGAWSGSQYLLTGPFTGALSLEDAALVVTGGVGTAVDATGDGDADGRPDLLFGLPSDTTSGASAGAAAVVYTGHL